MLSQAYLRCKVCHCCMNMSYRRSVATAATGKGFGKVQEREAPKERRGKKGQKQASGSATRPLQETRSPEEHFVMRQTAQAEGKEEPDAAFEQRLKALRENAKARAQSGAGSQGGVEPVAERSVLDAMPDFSTAPLERQRQQPQPGRREPEADSEARSGPSQALLGAGAIILAAIFAVTSFGGDGPSSSKRAPPSQQERKLGDEERADLERQAADLGKQLEGGAAQPEQLQRAAAVYATLGRAEDAAGALEQLVEKAPGNSSAWGMLADVKESLGDYKSASTAYKRAIAEAPAADLGLLEGLSASLVAQGRQKEAAEFLQGQQQALEGSASASKVGAVELQLLLGKVYSQWDRHVADALAVYDSIVQKDPTEFRGFLAKGVLLRKEGRKGDAQRAFLQARYNAPPEALYLIEKVIASGSR